MAGREVEATEHCLLPLPHSETANRVAIEADVNQRVGGFLPQLFIQNTLLYAEDRRASGMLGATVELEDTEEGRRVTYQIVGETEADVKAGKISSTSPIARALVGKSLGDTVVVQAPGGKKEYDVVNVTYV